MRKRVHLARAICMLFCALVLLAPADSARSSENPETARYRTEQLSKGAKTVPVLARLAYRDGVSSLRQGKTEAAEKQLLQALNYDPNYPDPYFTLAALKVRQLDIDATVYMTQAFVAMWRSFSVQALFLLNGILTIPYMLILISLIVCFAFAVKYLPFAAHKIKEFLQTRFNATLAGFSAYLLLLIPLVLVPGVITSLAYVIVVCWLFMYRRERFLMILLVVPFILIGFFGAYLRPISTIADPESLTSLIARTNDSPADDRLINALERAEVEGLEAERNIALGVLHQRKQQYATAADYFFRAISLKPQDPMGYINLGNVYFMQGQYKKALEGYRKAEGIEPMDPICQYALAQAYIKTLLMKEASKSLQLASSLGIEKEKAAFAEGAVENTPVLPKTFSNWQLWTMARIEGETASQDYLDEILMPFTRFPGNISAWILVGALLIAMLLTRIINVAKLTFQCSNCGRLTCENCCNSEREMNLCQRCAATIDGVTSEKVIDALLRQKRQAVLVSRRKAIRFATVVLPGVRDISYGKISRGFMLASFFSLGVIQAISRGFIVKDGMSLINHTPWWKIVLPVLCIVITYLMSILAKHRYNFKVYPSQGFHQRGKDAKGDRTTRVA